MTTRKYLVLAFICVSGALGDFCLKIGMSRVPSISIHDLGAVILAVKQPLVIFGILLLIGFFAAYLTALSWADLTYVLPATAFGYIVVALLSWAVLDEHISMWRWVGIALITSGVGFVTQGPAKTTSNLASTVEETPQAGHQAQIEAAGGMHP